MRYFMHFVERLRASGGGGGSGGAVSYLRAMNIVRKLYL